MRAALQRATRRPRLTAAALLGAAGVILLGQGAWIQAKAVLAQILLERAFAETLATGRDAKPWSWADTWPVARVEAPRLGRSAIVLHGSSGQALAFGPGHVDRASPAPRSSPLTATRIFRSCANCARATSCG